MKVLKVNRLHRDKFFYLSINSSLIVALLQINELLQPHSRLSRVCTFINV